MWQYIFWTNPDHLNVGWFSRNHTNTYMETTLK